MGSNQFVAKIVIKKAENELTNQFVKTMDLLRFAHLIDDLSS